MGGIKVEFGGFMGGFGKIFFTKRGIKREKEGFWRWRGRSYIFLKSFEGWRRIRNFMGKCIFGIGVGDFWVEEEMG